MGTTYYFWDEIEDNVIREYDDSNNTIAHYTTEPTRYGSVISQERSGVTRYYHFDGQGNTTELTDENGNVTDTRKYSAFGEVTESTGTTEFPFQFEGRWGFVDESLPTPSHYVRAREYVAPISRWLSVDPSGLSADLNPYRFVRNSPIRFLDPSGLDIQDEPHGRGPMIFQCCCVCEAIGNVTGAMPWVSGDCQSISAYSAEFARVQCNDTCRQLSNTNQNCRGTVAPPNPHLNTPADICDHLTAWSNCAKCDKASCLAAIDLILKTARDFDVAPLFSPTCFFCKIQPR